jgi:hypothetical protein
MINIQSALNPKQSYQITLRDPKAVQLFRYYLKYNSSKCDPFYDSPVLFQKVVHHVKVTSSVIWNHLQNNFKNKKTNSTRKNNAQNTQYYSYFFPAMVEKNEAPSSKLNQYEQNNEE